MRPTFDRRLWILLFIILVQCTTYTQQQNINAKSLPKTTPAEHAASKWRSISEQKPLLAQSSFELAVDAQRMHQLAVDRKLVGHNSKPSKCAKNCAKAKVAKWKAQLKNHRVHQAHRAVLHKEAKPRLRRETEEEELELPTVMSSATTVATSATVAAYTNRSLAGLLTTMKAKRARSTVHLAPEDLKPKPKEPVIIIDDVEEFDSGTATRDLFAKSRDEADLLDDEGPLEGPRALPLRPVLPNPYEDEEMSVVYADQHSEIRLMCEVDLDISSSMWYKNGQVVHAMDRTTRVTDYRFIKEANGALTITNVMLEDDGKWQCEAENTRRYTENARPVKLVVLDRPKPPYLLIDSRRLDAGNIFVPVKENSELNLACVSEGGNPRPTLTWEVLLSPGVDRHAQKVSAEVLELEEIKNEKDKNGYKINSGAKSEARLPAVYRAHHNARILCVMEHPTLKIRQNASLLLDVQLDYIFTQRMCRKPIVAGFLS
ncbi:uncharacterized protein LOC111595466 isoform X4 [Drosophila hydei]|uniref:Uncharacterized protein LOC111595466 isoform X4 n=1 Tax=Drosophila hydei TaxID=7224 RepID=A0A6J1LFK4_DROHY|nr:uncharacterized protein LOC111595466 isoform X4 [Drosophila hydei]